jgi:ferric-dicitrate binding protein FerR (iron transport regulator)
MNQDRIIYLVQRLRSGEASQSEVAELREYWDWAQSDQQAFESIPREEREHIRSTMLSEIRSRIAAHETRRRSAILTSWPLRIAAVFVLVAISYLILNRSVEQVQVVTAYGEQKTLTLPDGSSLRLNGNSAVKYAAAWSDDEDREIWLDGEGFLEVKHTKNDNKFTVHTAEALDVQVLGTRFNVKVRRGQAEVMLEEGRVRLAMGDNNRDTLTMKPGDLVTRVKQQVTRTTVNASRYASWKENKLYFDETPLFEVARLLEDTYGFEVEFKDKSLNKRKLSGEIRSAEGQDILTAIRESMDITITEDGRKVIFK